MSACFFVFPKLSIKKTSNSQSEPLLVGMFTNLLKANSSFIMLSAHLSVSLHGTIWLSLAGFEQNLINQGFLKNLSSKLQLD